MKKYSKFEKTSFRAVKPEGWLYTFLRDQADGLTGHYEVSGYPFDTEGWDRFETDPSKNDTQPEWAVYEQTGYVLDGMERAGQILRDRKLLNKAERCFKYTLNNADPDGYLGPKYLKFSGERSTWPIVVFFRALLAKYYSNGDKSILDAITKHYLGTDLTYDIERGVFNVEIMLLVYLETGNQALLQLAEKSFADYQSKCKDENCASVQMNNKKAYAHGVNYNEYSKLGALLYICTGNKAYLKPVLKAYKKIDRYQMLPDGCPCSDEFLLSDHYMETHETCVVSDYTYALSYVLMATGKAEYADKIEKCILNAGIGSVEEHFRGLQYFSGCNQLILDHSSNHCDFHRGSGWMSYRPNPGTPCCAGNVHRFFPNYINMMWMRKGRNSIFSVLFGASEYTHGTKANGVVIKETTDYPFSDEIKYTFSMKTPKKLKFNVRIPGWAVNPVITVNGEETEIVSKRSASGFALIEREFKDGDEVALTLPSELMLKENHGGYYFEKGPLLYTYGMRGNRQIDELDEKQTKEFPAYNIYPDKKWNYALAGDALNIYQMEPVRGEMNNRPFDIDSAPLTYKVKVRELIDWDFEHHTVVHPLKTLYIRPWQRKTRKGDFTFMPPLPTDSFVQEHGIGDLEEITLVPYAAAKCRMTVFKLV